MINSINQQKQIKGKQKKKTKKFWLLISYFNK